MLQDTFLIEAGRPPSVIVNWLGPSAIRRQHGPVTDEFFLSLKNDSNQDAELVSMRAWITDHPDISMHVSGPIPATENREAVGGYLQFLTPRVMVDEELNFTYRFTINFNNYRKTEIDLGWDATLLPRGALMDWLSGFAEHEREIALSNPHLETEFPELFHLAKSPTAWHKAAFQSLETAGFDIFSVDYLMPLPAAQSIVPGGPQLSDVSGPSSDFNDMWNRKHKPNETCEQCINTCLRSLDDCSQICLNFNPDCCAKAGTCYNNGNKVRLPASGDPNFMVGPEGYGPTHSLPSSRPLHYRVEFENLPDASAAAAEVRISNQLSANLEWSSLELNQINAGELTVDVPPGLNHFETRLAFDGWTWKPQQGWYRGETPLILNILAQLDAKRGLLTLSFKSEDPVTGTFPEDPYAGFLPPNANPLFYTITNGRPRIVAPGQGYLSYSIRPKTDIGTGTRIVNSADILFDFNDPIRTPEVFNTIDSGAPIRTHLINGG